MEKKAKFSIDDIISEAESKLSKIMKKNRGSKIGLI
jgi:hypothetical protein